MTDGPFDRIMAGLNEALRHAKGDHVHGMMIHKVWFDEAGVPRALRIDPADFYLSAEEEEGSASTGVAARSSQEFREEQ